MNTRARQPVPCRFRLPVSGHAVGLRPPTGAEDLLLLEGGGDDVALALANQVAVTPGDVPIDWRELPVTDLDAMILRLRQAVVGDRVQADVACQNGDCRQRIDISFSINEYLAHRQPASPSTGADWSIDPDAEPGWFRLRPVRKATGKPTRRRAKRTAGAAQEQAGSAEPESSVAFRIPTVADQLAVATEPDRVEALARRCLRPANVSPQLRQLAEEAMEMLAPSMLGELQGTCPQCGVEVMVHFDAREFCLRELRDRASLIYQDVDLLARRYHWSEREILTMPHVRRTNYAELARQEAL